MAILEAKLVISGSDQTSPAFKAITAKIDGIAKSADSASRVAARIASATADSFGSVSIAVDKVENRLGAVSRAMRGIANAAKLAGSAITTALAFEAVHAIDRGVKSMMAYQGALAHMKYGVNATEAEYALSQKASIELPQKYPNVSPEQIVGIHSELIGAFQHREEVAPSLEPAVAFRSHLAASGHAVDDETFGNILKSADLLNKTANPEKLKAYFDAVLRAIQIQGKLLDPSELRDFASRAGSARFMLSDRFLATTMPTLVAEQHGGPVGAAMSQIEDFFSGKALGNRHAAIKSLLDFGLLNESDVLRSKKGDVTGLKPRHYVKGAALGRTDPDLWLAQYGEPALDRKGITDENQRAAVLTSWLSGKNAPAAMDLMNRQRVGIANMAENYAKAGGGPGAEQELAHDPRKAMEAAFQSIDNAFVAATKPLTDDLAPAAQAFAKAVDQYLPQISKFATEHPLEMAGGFAGGAAGVVGGVGLTLKLAADYFASKVGQALKTAVSVGEEVAPEVAKQAPRVGAGLLGTAFGAGLAYFGMTGSANEGEDERARQKRFGLPLFASGAVPGAGLNLHPEQVTAKLDGGANIAFSLSIDAPPELLAILRTGVTSTTFGDLKPDLGTSMPGAAPGGTGRSP